MTGTSLLYFPLSQPSRAIQWFLKSHNIRDIELKPVDILSGATHTPEFTEKNPFQSVPVLQLSEDGHDDAFLTESSAIINYLATKYQIKAEYPVDDAVAMARIHEAQLRHDQLARLVTTKIVRPAFARAADRSVTREDVINHLKANSGDVIWALTTLDEQLGKQTYIAGNHFTVADYNAICDLNQLPFLEPLLPDTLKISATHFPHVFRYLEHAKTLPFYDDSVAGISALFPKLTL